MRKLPRALLMGAVVGVMLVTSVAPVVAAPPANDQGPAAKAARPDNRPGPFTARQEARRKAAQELILSGKASPNADGVVPLADDKYFEAAVAGEGRLFTILAEFGSDAEGRYGRVPGPLHNEISKPNREIVDGQTNPDYDPALPYDNFKHWKADFTTAYYDDLFFGDSDSMADFYSAQSSGNYTVAGEVSDWVTVPGNASLYGDNAIEDFGGAWHFIEDAGNAWYAHALAELGSKAAVEDFLADFDVWDRYDHDNDGNFDEPDGYIDHFQAVHAGEGEDAGGGAQGADAIWSHRWYVNATDFGATGPSEDAQFGGAKIGDTNYWLGDYTVEAENGGLGVFVHEYGHDLNLPDFYDTNAGENGTAFWTVMSSGSWLGDGTEDIGTRPDYMGPWEKLQLGWLDYSVVNEGETASTSLDPSEAVIVDVPDLALETEYTTPASGEQMWWSTSADDLNTTLQNSFDLGSVSKATLTVKAWYDIEAGFDYLHAEYSTDGGAEWIAADDPLSGSSNGRWKTLRYTIPGGADDTLFRFRFQSDGGVHLDNVFLDDFVLKSGGTQIFTDDVEAGADGWTAEGGWKLSDGVEEALGDRYYIAENRTYVGYDAGLETGPYQFSFALTDPDKVEHFVQQDGLLIWMVDETYTDNNTSEHAGRGLALPIDARFTPFKYSDGTQPSNRRQPFDATFGVQDVPEGPTLDPEPGSDELPCAGLHKQVVEGKGNSQTIGYLCAWPSEDERDAIPLFTDSGEDAYWDSTNPQNSTKVAGTGLTIEVTGQTESGPIDIEVDYDVGP
ncbi:MAG TPA: immune inhibitor A domain-containing protein [Candidatus Limnocylindrales bacterium]|nr:immune inhibitor A domain-containing protein [Candidatus Limnocylindrales bacterium]